MNKSIAHSRKPLTKYYTVIYGKNDHHKTFDSIHNAIECITDICILDKEIGHICFYKEEIKNESECLMVGYSKKGVL